MYTNPDCAIDPTHPAFTVTQGMDEFLEERRRRTREAQEQQALQATRGKERAKEPTDRDSLSALVASVKQKSKLNKTGFSKPSISQEKFGLSSQPKKQDRTVSLGPSEKVPKPRAGVSGAGLPSAGLLSN